MKMLKVLLVILVMAAMAAPVVIAEDRLSLAGQMRVRGWTVDAGGDSTDSWADQRFRLGGKIAIAEGVSITFRTDITETNWGDEGSAFGAGRMGDTQQWDRAHSDLTKGIFHLRAGQQYVGLGLSQVANSQDAGLAIDVKTAIPFKAFVLLDDNGNDPAGDDYIIDQNEFLADGVTLNTAYGDNILNPDAAAVSGTDAFFYGMGISPKGDNYASDLFFAGYNDGADEEVYLFGADLTLDLEAIKLKGEVNFFTGDASAIADAMGTQLYLDASLAATDAATVGAQFYYAAAADSDEVQYIELGNDFNGWDPIMDVGTALDNEAIDYYDRPFDFTGTGSGLIGGRLYGNVKVNDATNFGASVAYLTPEDDDNTDVDSQTAFAAGVTYALMANTSLQAQVQYIDTDDDAGTDEVFAAGAGLFVNF
ncbi:MAG: hypothetical protein KAT93_02065 [Desulfuromonadales bacterium]|nr:hypothetical protein [Desulfuromonadales bacterium]